MTFREFEVLPVAIRRRDGASRSLQRRQSAPFLIVSRRSNHRCATATSRYIEPIDRLAVSLVSARPNHRPPANRKSGKRNSCMALARPSPPLPPSLPPSPPPLPPPSLPPPPPPPPLVPRHLLRSSSPDSQPSQTRTSPEIPTLVARYRGDGSVATLQRSPVSRSWRVTRGGSGRVYRDCVYRRG